MIATKNDSMTEKKGINGRGEITIASNQLATDPINFVQFY